MTIDIMFLYHPKHCKECGTQLSDQSKIELCHKCSARLRARARRAERDAAGRCRNCGAELDGIHKQCAACRARQRARRKEEEQAV